MNHSLPIEDYLEIKSFINFGFVNVKIFDQDESIKSEVKRFLRSPYKEVPSVEDAANGIWLFEALLRSGKTMVGIPVISNYKVYDIGHVDDPDTTEIAVWIKFGAREFNLRIFSCEDEKAGDAVAEVERLIVEKRVFLEWLGYSEFEFHVLRQPIPGLK